MTVAYADSREAAVHTRLLQVLEALASQMPSTIVAVDLWRPTTVNNGGYADDRTEVWVRLSENVTAYQIEKADHWIQTPEGTVRKPKGTFLVLSGEYGVLADDHVVISGTAYLVSEEEVQAGIQKLTLDKQASRFIPPVRGATVYRQIGMKARIE